MDLTINSNAFVELNRLLSVIDIKAEVINFSLENNLLEGEVIISGKYLSDDMNSQNDFSKNVPFTVVFKDESIKIESIEIDDLKYQEIINQGIEVSFEIEVDYDSVLEDNDEKLEEKETELEVISSDVLNNDVFDDITSEIEEENEDIEETKDKITESYNDLLDDIFIDDRKNLEVKELEKENNRVVFTKFKEVFSSYRVYYPKNDRELEKICSKENKSLDDVYKTNSDYASKRRIIIK